MGAVKFIRLLGYEPAPWQVDALRTIEANLAEVRRLHAEAKCPPSRVPRAPWRTSDDVDT